jgi:hypothetical protein
VLQKNALAVLTAVLGNVEDGSSLLDLPETVRTQLLLNNQGKWHQIRSYRIGDCHTGDVVVRARDFRLEIQSLLLRS